MSHKPRVSVIVPSYNKPEYLPECLESIRAQTFTDWECIVVSDGSPRVEEIRAAILGMRDARFQLVELRENRGPGPARNVGLRQSRGDLALCVDEDDRLVEHCLEVFTTTYSQKQKPVLVPWCRYIGTQVGAKQVSAPAFPDCLQGVRMLGVGFLAERSLWDILGGYDESEDMRSSREDFELWLRILESGAEIYIIPQVLYEYRVGNHDASRNVRTQFNEFWERKAIVRKHEKLYKAYPKERRAFLVKGCLIEAKSHERYERFGRAALRLWQAAMLKPGADLVFRSMRMTLKWMAGKSGRNLLRCIRRATRL